MGDGVFRADSRHDAKSCDSRSNVWADHWNVQFMNTVETAVEHGPRDSQCPTNVHAMAHDYNKFVSIKIIFNTYTDFIRFHRVCVTGFVY